MNASKDPTELRARMAVLSIFRDLGISTGDALSVAEITQRWPEYGIRAGDLKGAIHSLVRDGLLAREAGASDRLVLTAVGAHWLRQQPAWLEYRLLVLRAARVRSGRRRNGRASGAKLLRRRSDPPTLIGGQ